MTAKWLGSLVRAREIQKDAAHQQLAAAERSGRAAHARAQRHADRIAALAGQEEVTDVPAFVAASVALQAAAATHSAARTAAEQADVQTADRRAVLIAAAIACESAGELARRIAVADQERTNRATQRDLDEVAADLHRRTAEAEA
jgi:putative heme iron utilization protein